MKKVRDTKRIEATLTAPGLLIGALLMAMVASCADEKSATAEAETFGAMSRPLAHKLQDVGGFPGGTRATRRCCSSLGGFDAPGAECLVRLYWAA